MGDTQCPKSSPIMHLIQALTFDSLIDIQSLIGSWCQGDDDDSYWCLCTDQWCPSCLSDSDRLTLTLMVRWLAPNWAGPPLTPLRPEPESSWTGSSVSGHSQEAGEQRGEIDKSKTLITTGYSASPVNMGLIWGPPWALYWYYWVTPNKDMYKASPLSCVLKNCY